MTFVTVVELEPEAVVTAFKKAPNGQSETMGEKPFSSFLIPGFWDPISICGDQSSSLFRSYKF